MWILILVFDLMTLDFVSHFSSRQEEIYGENSSAIISLSKAKLKQYNESYAKIAPII